MQARIAFALVAVAAIALLALGTTLRRPPHAIVLVRHAERADASPDTVLSPAGLARAERLADTLDAFGVRTIYVSQYIRTQQTAQPLAQRLGLTPVVVPAADPAGLVQKLRHQQEKDTVLVVGHSDTLPVLLKQLGIRQPVKIPSDEFRDLYIVVTPPLSPPTLLHLHY